MRKALLMAACLLTLAMGHAIASDVKDPQHKPRIRVLGAPLTAASTRSGPDAGVALKDNGFSNPAPAESAKTVLDDETLRATQITAWATVAVAAIAFVQAAFFLWQLMIMKATVVDTAIAAQAAKASADAAKATADSYRTAERALISAVGPTAERLIGSTFPDSDGKREDGWMFVIQWSNLGNTPAVNCFVNSQCALVAEGAQPPQFEQRPRELRSSLAATIGPKVSFNGIAFGLSDKDIEALQFGKRRYFLYGRAEYFDMFSEDALRHTQACFEATVQGEIPDKEGKMVPRFSFQPIGEQNTVS